MSLILDGSAGVTFPNSTVQASAGSVLQVVQASTTTSTSTSSASYVSTPLTVSITPKFSTSKILVITSGVFSDTSGASYGSYTIARNGTTQSASEVLYYRAAGSSTYCMPITYLDSPATTSSTTYALYLRALGGGTVIMGATGVGANTTATITVMEIAG